MAIPLKSDNFRKAITIERAIKKKSKELLTKMKQNIISHFRFTNIIFFHCSLCFWHKLISIQIIDHPIIQISNIAIALLDFSLLPLVKLSLLIHFASFLYPFFSLLKVITIILPLLSANAFKSVKERQLLLSQLLKER